MEDGPVAPDHSYRGVLVWHAPRRYWREPAQATPIVFPFVSHGNRHLTPSAVRRPSKAVAAIPPVEVPPGEPQQLGRQAWGVQAPGWPSGPLHVGGRSPEPDAVRQPVATRGTPSRQHFVRLP